MTVSDSQAIAQSLSTQKHMILVVEDSDINRDLLKRRLERLGYSVTVAANGQQALEVWRKTHIDLVMTDCRMPVMDGYTFARALRKEDERGAKIPIIAVTAKCSQDEEHRCLEAGMSDYLTKPIPREAIKSTLQKWLAEHNAMSKSDAAIDEAMEQNLAAYQVFDPSVLRDALGDNPQAIAGYVVRVIDNALSARNQMLGLLHSDEPDATRQILECAHKLKSSARTVGAIRLAQLLQKLEQEAKSSSNDRLARSIELIESEVNSLRDTAQIDRANS